MMADYYDQFAPIPKRTEDDQESYADSDQEKFFRPAKVDRTCSRCGTKTKMSYDVDGATEGRQKCVGTKNTLTRFCRPCYFDYLDEYEDAK